MATKKPSAENPLATQLVKAFRIDTDAFKWVEQATAAHRHMQEQAERLAASIRPAIQQYQLLADQVSRHISVTLGPQLAVINEALKELPEKERKAFGLLAEDGWYIYPEMDWSRVVAAAQALDAGDRQRASELMVEFLAGNLDAVEAALLAQLERRSAILEDAFHAHRERRFSLSVPVFLAQADGVCQDFLGVKLFSRRGPEGEPVTAGKVRERSTDKNAPPLLHPLTLPTKLTAGKAEMEQAGGELNRHEVLHGISVDYMSEENSYRAISLLGYLAWVLRVEEVSVAEPGAIDETS